VTHPTLLNSCARAATAEEARYRIQGPPTDANAVVIALDSGAVPLLREAAAQRRSGTRFVAFTGEAAGSNGSGGASPVVTDLEQQAGPLDQYLAGADVAVLVATSNAAGAAVVGEACRRRSTMTAAIIMGDGRDSDGAVAALRPYARVMIVSKDPGDVGEILSALRA